MASHKVTAAMARLAAFLLPVLMDIVIRVMPCAERYSSLIDALSYRHECGCLFVVKEYCDDRFIHIYTIFYVWLCEVA